MPKNKKYKKARKKFMRKRKMNPHETSVSIIKGPTVMPDELWVKLRFDGTFNFTGPGYVGEIIAANDLQSVINGGTAPNRPMGVEQLTPFYNNYQVHGSKASFKFLQDVGDSNVSNVEVALVPFAQSASIPSDMQQLKQQAYSKTDILSEISNRSIELSTYMTTKKILGYHGPIDDLELTSGSLGTGSPTLLWNWFFAVSPLGTTNMDVDVQYHLEYYVRLFRRKILPASTV